jgi:Zn-dependent protease with chaperone function
MLNIAQPDPLDALRTAAGSSAAVANPLGLLTGQPRSIFTSLDITAIRDPLDQKTLAQLENITGFSLMMDRILEFGIEQLDFVLNTARSVRASKSQLPWLYALLLDLCDTMDVAPPGLYVGYSGYGFGYGSTSGAGADVLTSGYTRPYIVLSGNLLELMDEQELRAVLAHELGHVKCGHLPYKLLARTLTVASAMIGDMTLQLGGLVVKPLELAVTAWAFPAERTADRACLLAIQDKEPCIRMLMKLAVGTNRLARQLDFEEFIGQAREYSQMDHTIMDKLARFAIGSSQGPHLSTMARAKGMDDFFSSDEYRQMVNGTYTPTIVAAAARCPHCGATVQPAHKFCAVCGNPTPTR